MSGEKKVAPEWYKRPEVDEEARKKFFDARTTLDHRQIVAELPAKMMLELGRLSITKKMSFNDFIEEILEEYLERQGVRWREAPDKLEEWLKYGPAASTGVTKATREYLKKLGVELEE